jgi:hypothetical protein
MNELMVFENRFELGEKYSGMLEIINRSLPEIDRATMLFNKTQSQMMDNMMTLSHPTPIRNLRQILAEIKKIRLALGEAYYAIRKKELEIKEKSIELKSIGHGSKYDLLQIEIEETQWQISCIQENVSAAIRKMANYSLQYSSIQEKFGLENFSEQDFEEEEERYHIMKAFEQGLNAARAHGGLIDEGNHIYLEQLGINGTVAQYAVTDYLSLEQELIKDMKEPTYQMQLNFLNAMAEKFKGCTRRYAEWKGLVGTQTIESLI